MNKLNDLQKLFTGEKAEIKDGGKTLYYKGAYHKVAKVQEQGVEVEVIGEENGLIEGYSTKLFKWDIISYS